MSENLISFKCPNCGKAVAVEEGTENAFCTYCGSPLHVQKKNHFFLHYANEAKIRKAEAYERVRLKEIEAKEAQAKRNDRNAWIGIAVLFGMALFGFIMSRIA